MLRPYICCGNRIQGVVISTQKAEPLKATRREEVTGYTGTYMTAPSMKEMNKLIQCRLIVVYQPPLKSRRWVSGAKKDPYQTNLMLYM